MVIKLPPSSNTAMRSYVLGTLRNRKVKGFYPHVYEVIISDKPELSKVMVPKTIKAAESCDSFMANFLFVDNIPSKLNVKSLVDSTKIDNIKGCRVFFLETLKRSKLGFIYIPKSLPYNKFTGLLEKLRNTDYPLDDGTACNINLNEVWFQPVNSDPPQLTDEECLSVNPPEFILTQYLYLHNIPPNFVAAQLLMGSPFMVKLYVFSVNDLSTQIGFIVLRGLTPEYCQLIIDHFRNLVLSGFPILVDEIYLKCYNLPELASRELEHIPRPVTTNIDSKKCYTDSTINGDIESSRKIISNISLSKPPPESCPLMKSEFICLSNLPKSMSRSAIIFDIGVVVGGCVLTTCSDGKTFGFVYLPDCNADAWDRVVSKLASKCVQGNLLNVHEVYLQSSSGSADLICDGFQPSLFIFIYNLPMTPAEDESRLFDHEMIFDIAFLDTDAGSRCAFVMLHDVVKEHQINDCLRHVRSMRINGKPLYAELLWLSDFPSHIGQPPEKRVRGLM